MNDELVLDLKGVDEKIALLNLTGIMLFPQTSDIKHLHRWESMVVLGMAVESSQEMRSIEHKLNQEIDRHVGAWLGEYVGRYIGWKTFAQALLNKRTGNLTKRTTQDRVRQGKLVGAMAMHAAQNNQGIKGAAEFCCSDDITGLLILADELVRNWHPRGLERMFKRLRSVAHLWAVFFTFCFEENLKGKKINEKNYGLLPLDQFSLDHLSGLKGFIKLSHQFLVDFSKLVTPRGPRTPLLDSTKCWKVLI